MTISKDKNWQYKLILLLRLQKKTIGCSFSSVLILFDDYCHYFKYDHGLFNDLGHGKLTY